MKIPYDELYITERRNQFIWEADMEGYSIGDIGKMFQIEKSWISRIVKLRPKEWKPHPKTVR